MLFGEMAAALEISIDDVAGYINRRVDEDIIQEVD